MVRTAQSNNTRSTWGYIEEMTGLFKSHLDSRFGKRSVRTPFPEVLILTKANEPREGEVERNIKRGYQRLVGSLLWCVRHVWLNRVKMDITFWISISS